MVRLKENSLKKQVDIQKREEKIKELDKKLNKVENNKSEHEKRVEEILFNKSH